ncbi:hypothetical protein CMI47_15150 [Candidatus Pacearchaeota archaeon]|nr:hypothetical protein [Candidatus Pacearchaeota archaeon]|tara:strand:+ start:541 stop:765 length:225 start_codon:yes stop_codon:yes gene_type:complete
MFKVGDLVTRRWVSKSQMRRVAYSFRSAPNSPNDLCIAMAIDRVNEMIKIMYLPSFEMSVLPLNEGYLKVVGEE